MLITFKWKRANNVKKSNVILQTFDVEHILKSFYIFVLLIKKSRATIARVSFCQIARFGKTGIF